MIDKRATATAGGTTEKPSGADNCAHRDPVRLRLIDYTRYGAWIGCISCGTSWLVRQSGEVPPGRG